MNIECGTDIIEISRIKEAIENHKESFTGKVYTQKEIEYCEGKKNVKYQHYAARFAAKEAVYKALSPKNNENVRWQDIEIINNSLGKPEVNLYNDLKNIEKESKIKTISLSLSHCKEYAVANVVILKGE